MSHPDNICLEAVTKLFENVSSMVNESKRKTEDYQAMLHLTQKIERFPPNLVSASRQFIQEIDCYYRSSLNVKKKATLFMFNDYIIVCTRQRLHTFTSKINRKRYSFYEQINMHHIQKLLICNDEDQPSTNLSRTKSRLKITQTRSDIRDLKTSKPGESLYGLGFMTTSNVVNWYSINIANDWQRRDGGTQRQVSAPGMEMNKSRINDKRYHNNYDYINGVKELILDLICKCKGKLTTDAMVKSMSLEEVACLLGQEKEGNLTPHESISDLSIISDTNSTRSAMFHDEGRENQTPSPTLSGFGNTTRFDRRASFGSKKLLEFGKTMKKSIVNGLTKNATFRNLHQAACKYFISENTN